MEEDIFRMVERPADVAGPGDAMLLPELDAAIRAATTDPSRDAEAFDPRRWNAEVARAPQPEGDDPVVAGRGRVAGEATGVVLLSDFHLSDGSAAGDDFLDSHLARDGNFGGLHAGFYPPGESRGAVVLRALAFARRRLAAVGGPAATLDVVLAGDVIDQITLRGRGGTEVSHRHAPLFRGLAALGAGVVWLRGNHDYVVPAGPWRRGEFYTHAGLQLLAEHGDFWDKTNWPPGTRSRGSRLVLEWSAALVARGYVTDAGAVGYLLAGLDNVRPLDDAAVGAFFRRRAAYSDVAAAGAALSHFKLVGAADDSAAYAGAQERRKRAEYRDWLAVQGHTHVPAAVPGAYYNLGCWITTLVGRGRSEEEQVEAFPFLLTYPGPGGDRVEEYYVVRQQRHDSAPFVTRFDAAMVNRLRGDFGYEPQTG